MSRFVGGVFGNTVGSNTPVGDTTGVFNMSQQYYIVQEGGWVPNDGSTEERAATSAQNVLDQNPSATDGFYWIKYAGWTSAKQIWCDMTDGHSSAGGVGGWNRFWWYGKYEQDNNNSTSSFPNGNCFGTSLETHTHTDAHSFTRIPSGVSPSWLMVKGSNNSIAPVSGKLRYSIWQFNNTSTANRALAAMQSGNAQSPGSNPNSNWLPAYNASGNGSFPYGDLDSFWYDDDWQSGRGKGFNLDDDNHYGNTAFAGGNDHAGAPAGVECFTGGDRNDSSGQLRLFWK